jgi:hypothetical protein
MLTQRVNNEFFASLREEHISINFKLIFSANAVITAFLIGGK